MKESGEEYRPENSKKKYDVKELLDGVESEEERRKRREESGRRDSTPRTPPPQPVTPADKQSNPWITVSVCLVTIVVIMATIAVISNYVPWYVLPIVIIGGILFFHQISVLQLMREEKLGQDTFRESMRDILKQLHLLKK